MATDRYVDLLKQGFMKPAKTRVNTAMPNRFECFTDTAGSFSYAQTLKEAKETAKRFMTCLSENSRCECIYVRDRAKNTTVLKWLKSGKKWVKAVC